MQPRKPVARLRPLKTVAPLPAGAVTVTDRSVTWLYVISKRSVFPCASMPAKVTHRRPKSRVLSRWRLIDRPHGCWQMFTLFCLHECRRLRASIAVRSLPPVCGYLRLAHRGMLPAAEGGEQPKPECRQTVKAALAGGKTYRRTTSKHRRRVLREWVRALRWQMRMQIVQSGRKRTVGHIADCGLDTSQARRCGNLVSRQPVPGRARPSST